MAKKIAIDAGHGLRTAGKQTPDGIKEWTLNDKVRDKIVALLSGYDVEFIFPDNDEGLMDEGLSKRRGMYVNEKVDAAVSIHHNAFKGTWCTATGVGVFVDRKATDADMELANLIQSKLPAYTGLKDRGVKKANFTVINQNTIPAVLVEGGFMDNKKDYAVITSDAGQTAYARAVAEALIIFLKLKKKSTPTSKKEVTKTNKPEDTKMKQIKRGSKGKAVRVWQAIIGVEIDGSFGGKTKVATIEFQKKAFPKDESQWDGVVGDKTWKAGLESI